MQNSRWFEQAPSLGLEKDLNESTPNKPAIKIIMGWISKIIWHGIVNNWKGFSHFREDSIVLIACEMQEYLQEYLKCNSIWNARVFEMEWIGSKG